MAPSDALRWFAAPTESRPSNASLPALIHYRWRQVSPATIKGMRSVTIKRCPMCEGK
jgi:hypothetical protein